MTAAVTSLRLVALAALALAGSAGENPPPMRSMPQPRLVIGRVMADPRRTADASGEWFEVQNRGTENVSLRGWRIASRNDATHVIARAVVVHAGRQVVLGRNANLATNGGVHVDYSYGSSLALANSADWLALKDPSGATVDSVAWTSTKNGLAQVHARRAPIVARQSASVPTLPGRAARDSSRELVVHVLDVGQGDATLITNGSSKVIIDGGPDPVRFGWLLDSLGLDHTTIDVVILSHQHYDHHAGLRELFRTSRGIAVRYFFENQDPYTNSALRELRDSVAARAGRGELVYRDTDDPCADGRAICTITMTGGAKLHVLRPKPDGSAPNDRSTPVKLVGPDSASFTMWFAGDAEQEEIGWFESARYDVAPGMRVDVLKADHHGSCNGVTSWYLRTIRPRLVAVSVGADNSYGHMHDQAKQEYARFQVPWYRTDRNGTIIFRSPGTPAGGFTVSIADGTAFMDGGADRRSSQQACNPLP